MLLDVLRPENEQCAEMLTMCWPDAWHYKAVIKANNLRRNSPAVTYAVVLDRFVQHDIAS